MYKVRGFTSEGESFYVDGSEHGKVFATVEDALAYAMEYARGVGDRITFPDPIQVPGWRIRTTKADGYYEDLRVVTS